MSRYSDEGSLLMDRIILEMLQSEGYRPSGNGLEANRERLVPRLVDDSEPSDGGDSR